MPKSITFTSPPAVSMMLLGLMSRWRIPARCAMSSPSATAAAIRAASAGGRAPSRRSRSVKVWPSSSSRTRNGASPSTKSNTRDDIGVVQLGRGSGFAAESPQRHRVIGQFLGQDLDRDPAAEQGVVGFPDLAHAAGVDPSHGPVAAVLAKRLLHHSLPSGRSLPGNALDNHPMTSGGN